MKFTKVEKGVLKILKVPRRDWEIVLKATPRMLEDVKTIIKCQKIYEKSKGKKDTKTDRTRRYI